MVSTINLDLPQVEHIAALAEACVHKPYPSGILHTLESDQDVKSPQQLYPAFYGCFDWHSAVHGHWLLARVARLYPQTAMAGRAQALLGQSLTAANLQAELAYLQKRPAFERPYGIAWLLQLGAELRQTPTAAAQQWATSLAPLETHIAEVFVQWLKKSELPVRCGTHGQTAFALGLAYDWSVIAEHQTLQTAIRDAAFRFYADDVDCPLNYEPSAHDFLSPCLAEADLMRRILAQADYLPWLERFLSQLRATSAILKPAQVTDPADGHLVHLDGLNLSRAWMMTNIARQLPQDHYLHTVLATSAKANAEVGLQSVINPHYAGGHWLGTFALYLMTNPGLDISPDES